MHSSIKLPPAENKICGENPRKITVWDKIREPYKAAFQRDRVDKPTLMMMFALSLQAISDALIQSRFSGTGRNIIKIINDDICVLCSNCYLSMPNMYEYSKIQA
jgi:hypothetical protein